MDKFNKICTRPLHWNCKILPSKIYRGSEWVDLQHVHILENSYEDVNILQIEVHRVNYIPNKILAGFVYRIWKAD